MITGLLLEGGEMRGLYTAGVFGCIYANHISIDTIIGASAELYFNELQIKQMGRVFEI